jgi:hypothetical protein
MQSTRIRFRTPNDVPPNWNLRHLLYKTGGTLTERVTNDSVDLVRFDDCTWEVIFYAVSKDDLTDHVDQVRQGRAVLTNHGCEIVSEADCTPKFSFSEFLEGLCKRPAMYTGRETFESVIDYLHGFLSGVVWCLDAPDEAQEAQADWHNFAWTWLREKFSDYQYPITGLRAASSDDADALEHLAAFWVEYQARSKQ